MRKARRIQKLSVPLAVGGAALLAFDAGRRLFRLARLFCPSREPVISWNPEDYGLPKDRSEEVWIESADGQLLHGWYCTAEHPIASGLYCHGNTGNLTTTAHVMPPLLASGINILLFDYRGFGRSSGRPSIHGVISDTIAAARFHDRVRPKGLPSILYGYSLGGAVAAQALRHHPFDGLILQSTFTNLPEITRAAFPRLPLHRFTGRLFDTAAIVQALEIPLLVIHGAEDEVCPVWMGEALHRVCGSADKRMAIVQGGLHKDLWERDAESLVRAIHRFAADLPCTARPPAMDPDSAMLDDLLRFARRRLRRV
ncbi:MAG TPA: alpha/beta fold hydrolase [Thermoanaerobaculia bacterium]|nr:alpha/beta fold hydrolase [Thermoanaerobaculia bacterium]